MKGGLIGLTPLPVSAMSCGREEKIITVIRQSDNQSELQIVSNVVSEELEHTLEECIKSAHDRTSLPELVEWLSDQEVLSFVLYVPFFRVIDENYIARMAVRFLRNRSGKYNMYAYDYQKYTQIAFGSYSGGGRYRIVMELVDEISAATGLEEAGYLLCENANSGAAPPDTLLHKKLRANRKFWNTWIETHNGLCPVCCIPPVLPEVPVKQEKPLSRGIVAKALVTGKLPPLSPDFNPDAVLADELVNEINGQAGATRYQKSWTPKPRRKTTI